jgi:uncharacterized protein with FMN-binding domain
MHHIKEILLLLTILLSCKILNAGGIYQQPDEFIKQVFKNNPASLKVIWPDKKLQQEMTGILGHKYKGLRIRYWIDGTKTAWILDEIGKEKPITTGIVINDNKIELVKILAFRESRGWEIKHSFFTKQFEKASLKKNMELNRNIDNISGATLSVRAVKKLARLALLLHQQAINDKAK